MTAACVLASVSNFAFGTWTLIDVTRVTSPMRASEGVSLAWMTLDSAPFEAPEASDVHP